jgi:hypothetical protein
MDDKTKMMKPTISKGLEKARPVSIAEFTNDFKEHVSNQPVSNIGTVKLQYNDREYALNVPVDEMMEAFKVLVDDTTTSDGKFLPQSQFKKQAIHVFKALPQLVQQVWGLIEVVKEIGLKYMDLNYHEGEEQYFTSMSLDETSNFLKQIAENPSIKAAYAPVQDDNADHSKSIQKGKKQGMTTQKK